MEMNTSSDLVYTALRYIGSAIKELRQPTGLGTEFGPFGERTEFTYATRTEQEHLEVTEDLIGAAFVLAQTYIKGLPHQTTKMRSILNVSNYWKHRDEWGKDWTPKNEGQRRTIDAVKALGAKPPVKPGQLAALAKNVLNQPFDIDALWIAIT